MRKRITILSNIWYQHINFRQHHRHNTTPSYQHMIILPTFCFLLFFHFDRDIQWYCIICVTYHKKNSKIDTISVDILFQIKSTQWYKDTGRKITKMALVQWTGVANCCYSTQREKKRMETTAQKEGITAQINCDTPTTQQTETQHITTIRMYTFWWTSCHIQYTHNSSQKQSFLSPI